MPVEERHASKPPRIISHALKHASENSARQNVSKFIQVAKIVHQLSIGTIHWQVENDRAGILAALFPYQLNTTKFVDLNSGVLSTDRVPIAA
jgi:hypothetical protein